MRHIVSNVAELVGAALTVTGIWLATNMAGALIAAGGIIIVYAWRLDQ